MLAGISLKILPPREGIRLKVAISSDMLGKVKFWQSELSQPTASSYALPFPQLVVTNNLY